MKIETRTTRILAVLLGLSVIVNCAVGAFFITQWLKPVEMLKTPEQRLQSYAQYLPQHVREQYRQRIGDQFGEVLTLQNRIRQKRKTVAELLMEKNPDRAALESAFGDIRNNNQQINRIYQMTLIEIELGLSSDERHKTHDFIIDAIKQESTSTSMH